MIVARVVQLLKVALLFMLSSSAFAGGSNSLTGSSWVLESIAPRGEAITPGPSLRRPTLKFTAGGVAYGSTGCNAFSARYKVKQETLSFNNVRLVGQSNCPDHALGLEADFEDILKTATTFKLTPQVLMIQGSGTRFIRFRDSVAASTVDPEALAGKWQVISMKSQGRNVQLAHQASLKVTVSSAQVLFSGVAGCNELTSKGELKGSTLTFSSLLSTFMACTNPGEVQAEQAVSHILRRPVRVDLSGPWMTWSNASGSITLKRLP